MCPLTNMVSNEGKKEKEEGKKDLLQIFTIPGPAVEGVSKSAVLLPSS